VPKAWSVADFILVVLGGFLAAVVFFWVSEVTGGPDELILVLSLVVQYLGHLLVLWWIAARKGHPDLGFNVQGSDALYVGIGLLLQLALAVLFLPLSRLLFPDGESAQQVGNALAELESPAARMAAVAVAVVLAPITEELTFRGVLLKAMQNRSRRVIIVVTALVFASFHVLGLDPSRMLEAGVLVLPQLFIVGCVLAWVTLRQGRLGPAIFIHSGFNLLAALVLLLPPEMLESIS
jgi:membrane protease YdiL (CAAX protease family)